MGTLPTINQDKTTATWWHQEELNSFSVFDDDVTTLVPLASYNRTNIMTSSNVTSPGPTRWLSDAETEQVHAIAVASLATSLLFSSGTIAYMFLSGQKQDFWRRKMAERLVIYLAVCDLCYSTEHIIDHTYLLIYLKFPPDIYCTLLAFFLQEFATTQAIIVLFTAINAYSLIVRERALTTGRYDWRLLVTSLVLPALPGGVFSALGALGPAEAWCMTDKRKSWTHYIDLFYAGSFLAVFIIISVSYGLVLYKIKKITSLLQTYMKESGGSGGNGRPGSAQSSTIRSARTMCIFIAAYIFQWFGYTTYSLWSLASPPPVALLAITVLVTNMGGVFNCIAYTLVRRIGSKSSGKRSVSQQNSFAHSQGSIQSSATAATNIKTL